MATRAKFVVDSRTEVASGYKIALRVVTATSEENAQFFKFTPSGMIDLGLVSPATAAQFVPGKEYYIDFVEVV